uniref:Plastin-1-like n=1 Tax=Echeneis naucrates TaxID=173247 RepID=A0A665WWL3_ECHNA
MEHHITQISREDLEDLREAFNKIDIDNSGYVNDFELQELFREASFHLPGYKVREIVETFIAGDTNKDEKISFEEFVSELKSKEFSETFRKSITRRDGIRSFGGLSRISSEGTQHSYSDEEKVAFVNWINKALAKDEDCQHLYAISLARKIGVRVYALPDDLVEVNPKMVLTMFACLMGYGLKKANR